VGQGENSAVTPQAIWPAARSPFGGGGVEQNHPHIISTPIRDLHFAFTVLYVCYFIAELCVQYAGGIQNHQNIRKEGQSKVNDAGKHKEA
jgi:hypothetical protein